MKSKARYHFLRFEKEERALRYSSTRTKLIHIKSSIVLFS